MHIMGTIRAVTERQTAAVLPIGYVGILGA